MTENKMKTENKVTREAVESMVKKDRDYNVQDKLDDQNWDNSGFLKRVYLTLRGKSPLNSALKCPPLDKLSEMGQDYVAESLNKPSPGVPEVEWDNYWNRYYEHNGELFWEFCKIRVDSEKKILGYVTFGDLGMSGRLTYILEGEGNGKRGKIEQC